LRPTHLPVLRRGRPYRSVDVASVPHFRTRQPAVAVSQANPGLVRRDLLEEAQAAMRAALAALSVKDLLALCRRAADAFVRDTLPAGEDAQDPETYVRQLSSTTGLPHVLVRRNMEKIRTVLSELERILSGLTRGLDPDLLDRGTGESHGHALSFVPRSPTLGVVLPSNSPGVHSLWVPALALKTALVLKPGGAEPWTPYRLIQAFLRAGAPPDAFGFYPTDHAGAGEILRRCGRGMVFGDVASTRPWAGDPRVEVHGPGYSKVLLGPDAAEDWGRHIDVIVSSIVENGGRSCVNASGVWVAGDARALADALAERLARIGPRAEDDPEAQLAPFANPDVARRISDTIDRELEVPGAVDLTAQHRSGGRLVQWEGSTYLLPTLVRCDSPEHPLANREFLFPFASVVPVEVDALPSALGPTLATSAITGDQALVSRLLASPLLHRLNLGPIPTWQVSWDQPHEGNLFEHLYVRRAVQGRAGIANAV
jgi:acyl-CoA reductase-like NAD-dependent aldehyde dehydrogenase